jgi:hypothetical protein
MQAAEASAAPWGAEAEMVEGLRRLLNSLYVTASPNTWASGVSLPLTTTRASRGAQRGKIQQTLSGHLSGR